MIQILGLRPYFNQKRQKWEKAEKFFDQQWRAPSVVALLKDPDFFLKNIPEAEHVNLYFTVADCHEVPGRKLKEQLTIPFDIDDVPESQARQVLFEAVKALGLVNEEIGALYSGHGVQFFVQVKEPILSEDYFDRVRHHYKALCKKISAALLTHGLPGKVDPSVWSPARLMRMPNTINDKTDKVLPIARSFMLEQGITPIDFDLEKASGIPVVAPDEQISPSFMAKYPEIDVPAVEAGCDFLRWCRTEPQNVKEYQWYAMLSIVGRFPNGRDYAHAYSKGHPGYNPHETDAKLDQATTASGPRTCKNISAFHDGCKSCPHFPKGSSPIMIQGPDFVRTAATGFHNIELDKNGMPKPGRPNVTDLWKYFRKERTYIALRESQLVYVFGGQKWSILEKPDLLYYADDKFKPPVAANVRNEFLQKVIINNLHDGSWFDSSARQKINFKNGVLDLEKMELHGHSPEFGFRYCLDYDYDENAECPRFDAFMDEITCGNAEYKQLILEFAGYCFSNDEPWVQKALFLTGTGANGKSTFMDILRDMAGDKTYSSTNMGDLNDPANRLDLDGALFNVSEETDPRAITESSFFKTAIVGGKVKVKRLYSQPYDISVRAKFIFSCNELPVSNDKTHALFRRMIIIPFNARFDLGLNADPFIRDKIKSERAGIFNRVMGAYREARKKGQLSETQQTRKLVSDYSASLDTVGAWLHETYEVLAYKADAKEYQVSKRELYESYSTYAKIDAGEKPLTAVFFWRRMRLLIPDIDAREHRFGTGESRERGFHGFRKLKGDKF